MKSFYDKEDYTIEDIQALIDNQVEESIYLDFKSAGSLEKNDKKRMELSKDVASFANSDGGIIVYGIKEVDHVASEFSFIDGNEFTKEWIEQVISSYVQRRISDVKIYPIRIDGDMKKSVYVVKIPYSYDAPHLSKDNRYYKRYNFMSVPMEEYEVRQSYGRKAKSELTFDTYYTKITTGDKGLELEFDFLVMNSGVVVESLYKLNVYISKIADREVTFNTPNPNHLTNMTHTYLSDKLKLSYSGVNAIYSKESLSIGRLTLSMPLKSAFAVLRDMKLDIILFYSNGEFKESLETSFIWETVREKYELIGYDWITESIV
ncbi:ATP-binding protein [Pedobacter agri]|uniref:AlbA family DNA-binding domain-containing protein n=1 Tax=Pedobacter agri TaxID=454586 RepID=UPI0029318AAB|nr:ATP-binding protein [Pedobacter agri]